MRLLWLFCLVGLVLMGGCGSRPRTASSVPPASQKTDISNLVPNDLAFAKSFVQLLVDSGWAVQPVRPSKLNGFFLQTKKAAWIDTDKGIMEVVFFDNEADVEQIQITQERSNLHIYILKTPAETRRMGGSATYFTKHGNMLIVTIDAHLNDVLNQLFASSAVGAHNKSLHASRGSVFRKMLL
jgi:hypothetical protein